MVLSAVGVFTDAWTGTPPAFLGVIAATPVMAVGLTLLAISWRKGGALSPVQATTVIVCAIASLPFGFTVLQHTPTGQLFLLHVVWIILGWQLARQSNRLQAPRTHANN